MKKLLVILVFVFAGFGLVAQTAPLLIEGALLGSGALISRPADGAEYVTHFGVMWMGQVAHYNETGFHLSSIEQFSGTATIKVLTRGLTGDDLEEFKKRAVIIMENYKSSNYSAMQNNCEHFAMEMVFGIRKSFQAASAQEAITSYWPVIREKMLKENPKSEFYVKLLDAYFKKYEQDTTINK